MNFIFVDESENVNEIGKYTSVCAAVFRGSDIALFRSDLVDQMHELLYPENDQGFIGRLPILHASCLPKEIEDTVKIELFKLVFECARKHNVSLIRCGYYDKSLSVIEPFRTRERRIEFCLNSILYPAQHIVEPPTVYVYELSLSQYCHMNSYNDSYFRDLIGDRRIKPSIIAIGNFEQILGKFYCDKHNHCMYVADFFAYGLGLSMKERPTEFQRKIIKLCEDYIDMVLYNEIIWMDYEA